MSDGPSNREPTAEQRQRAIDDVTEAMVGGDIEFEEIGERFAAIERAGTVEELEAIAPSQPTSVLSEQPRQIESDGFSLIGDVKRGGWLSWPDRVTYTTIIGDVIVDLSTAEFPPEGTTVRAATLIGDIKIIVPDGAIVQPRTIGLIGSRSQDVTAPRGGGPVVEISAFAAVGDIKVYSLSRVPEGALRRWWKKLRQS